jgi:DNA polymerase-3 subunit alpha
MARRPSAIQEPVAPDDADGPDFVHLHVHSEYSLLDGLGRIDGIVERVKAMRQSAIALTDHGNLHGVVEFNDAARKAGIKPIIGCEVYVAPRALTDRAPKVDDRNFHLTLLARDQEGYRNLLRLVSTASTDGFYYKPRIDKALLERHAGGLTALSGCMAGELSSLLLDGQVDAARRVAGWHADLFGRDHYFIEVLDQGLKRQAELNRNLIALAREIGVRVVATNDAHYVAQSDAQAHDILLCIQTGATVDQPNRLRLGSQEFHLRSGAEMARAFPGMPEVLSNTLIVAEQVDFTLDFSRVNLPRFDLPDGHTPSTFLRQQAYAGLAKRYGSVNDEQRARLEYELDIIDRTGYPLYFLIVADYVRFARENGILAMPRGSVAGSLVIHALGVCDIDPLAYRLMFERFLHEERIGMPDIDMDFADDRREEVIRYVQDKYGRDRVAQIITFGTMAARAAVRDVARVMGLSFSEVSPIARAIPFGATIAEARETSDLKEIAERDPRVAEVLDLAAGLEGVSRNASTHAAGIVISRDPLVEHVPLQRGTKGDDTLVTQWPMGAVEQAGMLKMDFLGLANLTIVDRTLRILKESQGIDLDLNVIPTDDSHPKALKAFEMLGEGETTAVFQLESDGMRRCLRGLKPNQVSDLIAIVALYRPGPMENIPAFTAAKNGSARVRYLHPVLRPILEETYGVCVYQDQVLQMVREVAGFTWGEADVLRKAMGKKIAALMSEQEEKFRSRAIGRGFDLAIVQSLWDIIAPFAGYGFPKGHAAAYAVLAFQTAYLKANYPAAYMAAVLTSTAGTPEKVSEAIHECRRLGVPIGAPDVNRSGVGFTLEARDDGTTAIRFGFSGVKFVADAAVEAMIAERGRGGAFASLNDLCGRLDLRQWNKRALESLVKAGALDAFGDRPAILAGLDAAIATGQQASRARQIGQTSLFDLFGAPQLPSGKGTGSSGNDRPAGRRTTPARDATALTVAERRQNLAWEKEVLGLYLSEHPLTSVAAALRAASTCTISGIDAEMVGEEVTIAGSIASVRPVQTRRGDTMGAVQLEDLSGQIELVVFPRLYQATRTTVTQDSIVLVRARVDTRNDTPQLVCDSIEAFDPDQPAEGIQSAPSGRRSRTHTSEETSRSNRRPTARKSAVDEAPTMVEVVATDRPSATAHDQVQPAVFGHDDASAASASPLSVDHPITTVFTDALPATPPAPTVQRSDDVGGAPTSASPPQPDHSPAWADDLRAGMHVVNPAPTTVTSQVSTQSESPRVAASTSTRQFAEARPTGTNAYATQTDGPDQVSVIDVTLIRHGREDRDLRTVERLAVTLRKWPGAVPVVVRLIHPNGTSVAIAAAHRVDPCRDLIESLQRDVGVEHVQVRAGATPTNASGEPATWGERVSA